jgi:hypothetical protein
LVPDGENADFIAGNYKPVKGNVSGVAIRNNQFAQFTFEASAHQRVGGEIVDRGLDCRYGIRCGIRIFVA